MIMKIKQEGLKGPQIQLELYLGLLETLSLYFHYHFRPLPPLALPAACRQCLQTIERA